VPYKIVDCYSNNIIEQVRDCKAFMWNWGHSDFIAKKFVLQLTHSLEMIGIVVFPNIKTGWHYDDKLGQKYLLEAINAPSIPTHIFYNKSKAIRWAKTENFPKVFKTRNGAGAMNVKLIKNSKEAINIIKRSFGKGIPSYNKVSKIKDKWWKFKRDRTILSLMRVVKHILKSILPLRYVAQYSVERNYAYFQDFIPNSKFDYRMKVIGNRCWGFRRNVRENDFRASGSGLVNYDPDLIPEQLIKLSFDIAKKLKLQSVAFDFIEHKGSFKIIELSYSFGMTDGQTELGYWDSDLKWKPGKFNPEYWMIEDVLEKV